MAPRTISELEDLVDDALAWRKVELQALKTEIDRAERRSPGAPLARALARSGVAMLYAHWEGFVKESCQAYVDYVAKRRLLYKELNDGLLESTLMALHRKVSTGSDVARAAMIEMIRSPDSARARVPKATIVDTKSNLRTDVLCEILGGVGFSSDDFRTKGNLIDLSLCDARNSIAHGRNMYPSEGTFGDLYAEILGMMNDIRALIVSGARDRSYKSNDSS